MCCGRPKSIPRKLRELHHALPSNPAVEDAVPIIFLGAGTRKITGPVTGLYYHVGSQRRYIDIERRDVDGILKSADFIRKP